MGGNGLALHLVLLLAMCVFKIAIFELSASVKWMPQQSKLKSGTCIMKNIFKNYQGLYYNYHVVNLIF